MLPAQQRKLDTPEIQHLLVDEQVPAIEILEVNTGADIIQNRGQQGFACPDRFLESGPLRPAVKVVQGKADVCGHFLEQTGDVLVKGVAPVMIDIEHRELFAAALDRERRGGAPVRDW